MPVLLVVLPAAALACGCAEGPQVTIDVPRCAGVHRIAVLPFTDGPGADGVNSGNAVSGVVVNRFAQSRRFKVLERSQLQKVMQEQDLQATDLVDPSTAARIGKLAGVDAVVTGTVSQYSAETTVVYVYVVPVVGRDYRVGASLRLVDVSTGDIIYSCSASGASGNDFTEAGKRAAEHLVGPLLSQSSQNSTGGPEDVTAAR